ncbi:chromosome segregation protein SMC [Conchiformibius kuhniae]|uniref:Chromosome partition protein Smc n=1 Tax=Conchiformibius kuhniae TaxID=211502 RepID=A0A8T9N0F5_9NEIS|nr:chromosome segregation protein SMC [Conchiformibius kuhniae]
MRLTHIKLSGFKSFAETTVIAVPGRRVAVVGPNGCGKSNVIDAVRWVLGESSAKQLRGEHMQDVIFNGASGRRAAARAWVELVFDNSAGLLGGAWGQYAEISIKRQLSRQGESLYFINGQTVRRRDITELFLGTGVGVRGYAVIEQGMITRIIDARPDELRGYLEEAAGVSKYKERRRETESRLADTRAHLQRLADLRGELAQQTEKLRVQAAAAERHQALEAELASVCDLADFIQWQQSLADADRADAHRRAAQAQLDETEAQITAYDNECARLAGQEQQQQQQRHQLAREHALLREQTARLEEQLHAQRRHQAQRTQQRAAAEAALHKLAQERDTLLRDSALAEHAAQQQSELAQTLAEAAEQAQNTLDEAQAHADRCDRDARQADNHARHAAHQAQLQHQQWQHAAQMLQRQQTQLAALAEHSDTADHTAQTAALEQRLAAQLAQYRTDETRLREHETELAQLQAQTAEAEAAYRTLHHRQTRLQAAEHALARWTDTPEHPDFWQQLPEAPVGTRSLWQDITIEDEWRQAAYALLAVRLNARCAAEHFSPGEPLPQGEAAWFYPLALPDRPPPADALQHRITLAADSPFAGALAWCTDGVRCAPSLQQALSRRHELRGHEIWLTPEGHRIDRAGACLHGTGAPAHSALAEQARLREHLRQLAPQTDQAHAHWQTQQQACTDTHTRISALNAQLRRHQEALQQTRQDWAHHTARCEQQQAQQRHTRTLREAAEQECLMLAETEHTRAQACAEQQDRANAAQAAADAVRHNRDAAQHALAHARHHLQHCRQTCLDARERAAALQQHLQQLAQSLQHNAEQQRHWQQQQQDQADGAWPDYEEQIVRLDSLNELCAQTEDALTECGQQLQHTQTLARQTEQQRRECHARLPQHQDTVRDQLLLQQEALLAAKHHYETLSARHGGEPDCPETAWAHLKTAAQHAPSPRALARQAETLRHNIKQLGAVNLAALHELEQAAEREQYYQNQHHDLQNAVALLQEAIAQIDRDTEARFRATFDAANAHMQNYFPTLFGGGSAQLTLVGDTLLDAGVAITARPPGKKNSSIKLLSGGEKALTAMSLVFALFSLNPAPFCLLDEVDAPLDDANTARFCRLLEQMSAQTQFLYISHNRLTMESAEQLVGVTMQEQGVSRVVAVDVRQDPTAPQT